MALADAKPAKVSDAFEQLAKMHKFIEPSYHESRLNTYGEKFIRAMGWPVNGWSLENLSFLLGN